LKTGAFTDQKQQIRMRLFSLKLFEEQETIYFPDFIDEY